MKRFLIAALAAVSLANMALAADAGNAFGMGHPSFYGRLNIGGYPQPQVIYRQPMAVRQVSKERAPIYLRVPLSHSKHWSKHCRKYNACGEWVYFVRQDWYKREYVPRYKNPQRDGESIAAEHREDYLEGCR
jgi:hypothetical protein